MMIFPMFVMMLVVGFVIAAAMITVMLVKWVTTDLRLSIADCRVIGRKGHMAEGRLAWQELRNGQAGIEVRDHRGRHGPYSRLITHLASRDLERQWMIGTGGAICAATCGGFALYGPFGATGFLVYTVGLVGIMRPLAIFTAKRRLERILRERRVAAAQRREFLAGEWP